jgi:hypothetical protein
MRSKTSNKTAKRSKPAPVVAPDETRVAQVFLWIIQGHTHAMIVDAIAKTWPDVEPRTLVDAAQQKISQAANFNPNLVRGWCIEAYRELHARLHEMGEYASALRAVKQIKDMLKDAPPPNPDTPPGAEGQPALESAEAAQARAHLAPLFKNGDKTPLAELARQAAARIVNQ